MHDTKSYNSKYKTKLTIIFHIYCYHLCCYLHFQFKKSHLLTFLITPSKYEKYLPEMVKSTEFYSFHFSTSNFELCLSHLNIWAFLYPGY